MLTVYGSKEKLLWLDNVEEPVYVLKCLQHHLFLCELDIGVISMGAIMDNAVHVQIEVVIDRYVCAGTWLICQRISLAEPAKEFGDPYKEIEYSAHIYSML